MAAGAAGAKAAVDGALTPEQQILALQAGGGVLAVIVAVNVASGVAKKVGEGLVDAAKLGLLGAATLAVAGKVLELY